MILKVILLLTNIICVYHPTSWCSDSPMQMCFMGCAQPRCNINQCAYREGACCNYNCKSIKM